MRLTTGHVPHAFLQRPRLPRVTPVAAQPAVAKATRPLRAASAPAATAAPQAGLLATLVRPLVSLLSQAGGR